MKKAITFILLFLLIPLNIGAQSDKFEISCEKESFKEFENFTCRTKVSGNFLYDKITFDINLSEGIMLNETRSNYTALWKVTNKKNTITAKLNKNDLVNGIQEFGILLFSLNEYGDQKININNIILTNSKETETLILDDSHVDIKIESSENRLDKIIIDGKKISSFTPNTYSYYIESSKEEIEITAKPIDKNSAVIGDGIIKLNPLVRETIVPIIVTSENGINKIYKLYIINKNILQEEIYLNNIEIYDDEDNFIDIGFNKEIFEYNLELKSSIKEIKIKAFIDNDNISFVDKDGVQIIDINDGDSIALIKIKNENGNIQTYTLNITRLLDNKSSNAYLKTLSIEGYDLKFNKKIKQYYLAINKKHKTLNINAIAEDKKATVSIVDNEDLREGSLIKVIVTAENSRKNIYHINITDVKSNTTKIISLFIIAGLLLVLIIKTDKNFSTRIKNFKIKIAALKEKINKKSKSKKKKHIPKKKSTSKKKSKPKKKTPSNKKTTSNKKPTPKKKNTAEKKTTVPKKQPQKQKQTLKKKTGAKKTTKRKANPKRKTKRKKRRK